ncbi:MAG: hypothetical protein K2W86_05380 [Sphingomonas sp.]|uniref:hypothetical protein n=1 Tax=Sphingomonas sp. TaxID=28214 RepID=UPI0035A874EC|nr:hypothetical protein [Sphingomonas sp.]
MRFSVVISLISALVVAGCSAPEGAANNQQMAKAPEAATPGKKMLGDEPASSPSAIAAKETVDRYFSFIRAGDYDKAYVLWGDRGGDTRGTLKTFSDGFKIYSVFEPVTGEPTAIKMTDGKQYILVTATIDVKNRKKGTTAHREGVVMLRRSADPTETDPEKKEWRIWGVDIRVKN